MDYSIPRFSSDLIHLLDEATVNPKLPKTASGWQRMNQEYLYSLAYAMGQRALVDALVEELKADEERASGMYNDDSSESSDDSFGGMPKVLDPSGELHQLVASAHLAAKVPGSGPPDEGDL